MPNTGFNSPNDYENLNDEEKEILRLWIFNNLGRSERFNKKISSYYLKEIFESLSQGFPITNGQMKGAMLKAEYRVEDENVLNWHFNIHKLYAERLEDKFIKRF